MPDKDSQSMYDSVTNAFGLLVDSIHMYWKLLEKTSIPDDLKQVLIVDFQRSFLQPLFQKRDEE